MGAGEGGGNCTYPLHIPTTPAKMLSLFFGDTTSSFLFFSGGGTEAAAAAEVSALILAFLFSAAFSDFNFALAFSSCVKERMPCSELLLTFSATFEAETWSAREGESSGSLEGRRHNCSCCLAVLSSKYFSTV